MKTNPISKSRSSKQIGNLKSEAPGQSHPRAGRLLFSVLNLLLFLTALPLAARAGTVIWTNTAGGLWSTATNWSPNQVPASGDIAVITNGGNYTVTLDSGATVGGIVLGASSGTSTQTLAWTGGVLRDCVFTLSNRGVLSLSGAANKELADCILNNGGTVIWNDAGALQASMVYSLPPVLITNLAGGIFDIQSDADFTFYDPGYGGHPTILFYNAGILRKSGGTGAATFADSWNFINSGLLDVQTGTLAFTGDNTLIGGTLNFGLTSPSVFGKLAIPSSASVRSIIRASLNSPEGLSAGNQFQVLNQGSRRRNAVVFAGRNLGNELVYDPVVSSSAMTLVLRAATHPAPPVLSLSYAPQLPAFVLLEGQNGTNYQLQASTDLSAWTSLQTNSAPTDICEFSDSAAPNFDHRFYRTATPQP